MSPTKKIEDLVYSGKVMDDHGNWISIAEQLKKEKRFLRHLERGEVLINGTWIAMSDLKKTAPTPIEEVPQTTDEPTVTEETTLVSPPASPEETVSFSTETIVDLPANHLHPSPKHDSTILIRTPEETVSFSTDTIRDYSSEPLASGTGITTEFPPETKSLFFEPVTTPEETRAFYKTNETDQKPQSHDPTTEFEETVLYNIKILKNAPASPKQPESSPSPQSASGRRKSMPAAISSLSPDQLKPSSGFHGSLLVVIAIIVVFLLVMAKLFL